jgi:site-specific DNA recombinase
MNAAIYARKSPDSHGIAAEEARSIKRQTEHARAYAKRKGWTVAEEHAYVDDQVSGAVFGDKRPGLARLLNVLTPRPPFQVLIMSEEQRLGRESIESGWTLKRILDAGVRVFFYLEDRERTLDTAMDKVMLSLVNFAGEMERERASQRTHDALLRRARAGQVANGVVFGYRNVPVVDGERRLYSTRVIEPAEASVVRRIFERSAGGWGYQRIAKALNDDGAPAPSPRRPGRAATWSPTTVRDALFRETYRGRVVWNQRHHVIRNGVRKAVKRPASEWLAVDVPELRIVDDALWTAAHERLAASRAVYLEQNGGRAWTPGTARQGATPNGIESPYLLTGFLSCGACGGPLFAHRHGGKNRRFFSYLCTRYHTRGRVACKNGFEANMLHADRAVLDAVERDVLCVEILETTLWKALDVLRPQDADAAAGELARLRDELGRLDAEVVRLAGAIAAGGDLPALLDALQDRERRRAHLRAQLAGVERERASQSRHGDVAGILDALRGKLTDWQGMLHAEVGPARQALRALLAGRLVFTPEERDGERLYTFEGPGTASPILAGVLPTALASRR